MSIRKLAVEPHPVLRAKAKPIRRFTADLKRLARDLIDTMYANDGIGIAAPQVGVNARLFIANPSQKRGSEIAVVNPEIEEAEGSIVFTEGCLSVPNIWGKVERPSQVVVRAYDLFGKPMTIEASGLLAVVLQHEIDHLDGKLFIDRLPSRRKSNAARARIPS